jgi:hypothetical protein
MLASLKQFLQGQAADLCKNGPPEKSARMELDLATPFAFERQGQWVTVYFDNTFYIGQVTDVVSSDKAIVNYLEKIGESDNFKWPRHSDIADTEAIYVFDWDFDVQPGSSDLRTWKVNGLKAIIMKYRALK